MSQVTYYIDGTDLTNSTGVWTDENLTTCAPEGYYSDSNIGGSTVRYLSQSGGLCVLGALEPCPSCLLPCDSAISPGSLSEGYYSLTFSTGSSLGATVIYFDPQSIPDGIRVSHDATVYNEVASENYGYAASSNPGSYVLIGDSTDTGSCTGSGVGNLEGTYILNESIWSGTSFVATGNTQTVTIATGDIDLSPADPGFVAVVIPKISNATSQIPVTIEMIGVCGGTFFDIEARCPIALTGIPTSNSGATCGTATYPNTYYNVPKYSRRGTPAAYGDPEVNEWFFQDENGQNVVADGTYKVDDGATGKLVTVVSGVITTVTTCP